MLRALRPGPPQVLERCVLTLLGQVQNRFPRLVVCVTEPQTCPHAATIRVSKHGLRPVGVVRGFKTDASRIRAFEVC